MCIRDSRSKEPTQYHATGRDENGDLIFGSPVRTGSGELSYAIGRDGTMTTYMEASLNYDHLFADKHLSLIHILQSIILLLYPSDSLY